MGHVRTHTTRHHEAHSSLRTRAVSDPGQVQQRGRSFVQLLEGSRRQRLVQSQWRETRNVRGPQRYRVDLRCRLHVHLPRDWLRRQPAPSMASLYRRVPQVWEIPTAIKRVQFSEDDTRVLAVTEQRMGFMGTIRIFDISSENEGKSQADEPSLIIDCGRSKATVAGWTALDKYMEAEE